jgi:hypothetical protein
MKSKSKKKEKNETGSKSNKFQSNKSIASKGKRFFWKDPVYHPTTPNPA